MSKEAITLKEAYVIENLRKQDVTNEKLLEILNETIEDWDGLIEEDDFDILKSLAKEDSEKYTSVIQAGYRVKFLTLNGLINLVQLKFNKEKDLDFTVHDDGISNLKLDENRHSEITEFLSQNWKVKKEGNTLSIRSVNS